MYCTKLLHHTYTKIWTSSCWGISENHGIFFDVKETHDLVKKLVVSVLRRLLVSFFSPPQKQTRVRFDSAIRSPVPQGDEGERCEEKTPHPPPHLTSVPLHLLQQWTPCQTEGWAELHPGATTAAPGSFGFDDTETTNEEKTCTGKSTLLQGVKWSLVGVFRVRFGWCLAVMYADWQWARWKGVNWEEGKTNPDTGTIAGIFTTVCLLFTTILSRVADVFFFV